MVSKIIVVRMCNDDFKWRLCNLIVIFNKISMFLFFNLILMYLVYVWYVFVFRKLINL